MKGEAYGRDMRTADPTRAVAETHVTRADGAPKLAIAALSMQVVRWGKDGSGRVALYMMAVDTNVALCFLPTPEELVETGKVLQRMGEDQLAEADKLAADALAKVRGG